MRATDNVVGLTPGERFARNDRHLDSARRGPLWLSDERIADAVCAAIETGADPSLARYGLHAYVVMPNHVHMLATPNVPLRKMMQALKGATARTANQILRREGIPFWQDEYYDHACRNADEFETIRNYIAMNPVKANLAQRPEDWKWSSEGRAGKVFARVAAWVEAAENATS